MDFFGISPFVSRAVFGLASTDIGIDSLLLRMSMNFA
jgi:hypothetical protein